MSTSLCLPEGARLIHIGPQKTGTTAIQLALFEARDDLPAHGAYCPGGGSRRRKAGRALGLRAGNAEASLEPWTRLAAEVANAGPLRVCISNEDFARAEPETVARIVEDLGGERVHVVAVTRRLDRFLPSQWQERVKGGVPLSFDDWLRVVLAEQDDGSFERWNVWMGHDTERLVNRWLEHVRPENLTLVIADERDPAQLMRVFESMLGLPEGLLRVRSDRSNQSLGLAEVELVRHLATAARKRAWTWEQYRAWVVREVVGTLKTGVTRGPSATLPAWAHDRVRELSEQRVRAVRRLPVRVIGELEHLLVPERVMPKDDPVELSIPVAVAAEVIEAVLVRAMEEKGDRSG